MELIENRRESMRHYLLGLLPEAQQTALEDEYLNDEECFEQMVAVETDLVDGYLRDRLLVSERRQFEHHYLAHPDRRARVQFAQALHRKTDEQPTPAAQPAQLVEKTSWLQSLLSFFRADNWQLGLAAATAMLLLGAVALYSLMRPNPNLGTVAVNETPTPAPTSTPERELPPSSPAPSVTTKPAPHPSVAPSPEKPTAVFASLSLLIGGMRGSGDAPPTLTLAPDVNSVRLQLHLDRENYPSYRVTVRRSGGAEVWRKQGLKPMRSDIGERLTLVIPADKLAAGRYDVTVSGGGGGAIDEISTAYFRVERK